MADVADGVRVVDAVEGAGLELPQLVAPPDLEVGIVERGELAVFGEADDGDLAAFRPPSDRGEPAEGVGVDLGAFLAALEVQFADLGRGCGGCVGGCRLH